MIGYGISFFTNQISGGGGTPPANTVAPVISGTQVVGSSLSSTTGTWTGSPAPTFTYQWYRGATLITGATSSTYTLVQTDAGNTSNITCQVTGTNSVGSSTATSNTLAQILDADANTFLTNASISDSTQRSAINTLTIGLKTDGIWTKMKGIWPFVGGTSSTHKWNLKDPRDLDAAFRIVWSGGITHNSNGVTFGGVNGFGNTFLTPSLLPQNSNSQMFYNRVLPTTVSYNGTNNFYLGSYSNGTVIDAISNSASGTTKNGTFNGLIAYIRRSSGQSDSVELYRNGVTLQTNNFTSTTPSTNNYYIGAYNNAGTTQLFSSYNLAFGSLGESLTDTEAANLYTRVQTFQTTLGRQV